MAQLGAGDDRFVWNPGDGSDTIEGQGGSDTMQFNGANVSEKIDISANGERVRFTRDVASITMDLNDVEHINFKALGGTDNINVRDLSGTDVKEVAIDLADSTGVPDAQKDQVTLEGTLGDDIVSLTQSGTATTVNGLAAQLSLDHADAGLDVLAINSGAGDDVIDASDRKSVV